jgi:dolichol-phosphate mannosyltransferase
VETPIAFTDRVRGYSKMTAQVAAEELALVTWWGVRDRAARVAARLRPAR